MKFQSITIKNFKSIRDMTISKMENACIIIGKNSTGKTVILDAVMALCGMYTIKPENFNEQGNNIEIGVELAIDDEDLHVLHEQGSVSKYRKWDLWIKDFCEKLPSYKDGVISFVFIANNNGRIRYYDGFKKDNKYITQILPKVYYIDHDRSLEDIQSDILLTRNRENALKRLQENKCMFDDSKDCNSCFQCMGVISKKTPDELSVFESEKLLEYKLVNLDMENFTERLNYNFHKNSGLQNQLSYRANIDLNSMFNMGIVISKRDSNQVEPIQQMSAGMKSIYVLSLLETYLETENTLPCIIMMEDPEIFLHPQLQKVAGEILYRLSMKNQVFFSTHSPNMIFNFNTRQIKQVMLDDTGHTVIKEHNDIDKILNDLGYSANDLMNVSFVFIVEGKQDRNRLPLLLNKYYSEVYGSNGQLQRIAIIATNSCTNIKTYANLKYMNQVYLKDQFLMIRDSDGKNKKMLQQQLCNYYMQREHEDQGNLPRVTPKNVLILKYYSFENYFLDPKIMAKIGVIRDENEFYNILFEKYNKYLYKLSSFKNMRSKTGIRIKNKADLKRNLEYIKIYGRGHNLFDLFYSKYRGEKENDILRKYIEVAPRENFEDILEKIDSFIYFDSRKKK